MRYAFFPIIVAAFLLGAPPDRAPAQQDLEDWPYRFVISGPSTAQPGDEVAYVVTYEQVVADPPHGPDLVFTWPPEAAALLSTRVLSGPEGETLDQVQGESVNYLLPGRPAQGQVEFLVLIDSAFTGDLRVTLYVKGTSIRLPEDSVTELTTVVSPADAFPPTGHGGGRDAPSLLVAALAGGLALAGAALLAVAGWGRRLSP